MGADRTHEIEARVNAATPGPWYVVGPPWNEGEPFVNAGYADPHGGEVVCDFTYMGDDADWRETSNSEANADFVAAAREDVPWLLARVRELEAALRSAYAYRESQEGLPPGTLQGPLAALSDASPANEEGGKVWGPERMRHDPERS